MIALFVGFVVVVMALGWYDTSEERDAAQRETDHCLRDHSVSTHDYHVVVDPDACRTDLQICQTSLDSLGDMLQKTLKVLKACAASGGKHCSSEEDEE